MAPAILNLRQPVRPPSQALLRAGAKLSSDKVDGFLRRLVQQHRHDDSHITIPAVARVLCARCRRDGQQVMTADEEAAVVAALTRGMRETHVHIGGAYLHDLKKMLNKLSTVVSAFMERPVGERQPHRRHKTSLYQSTRHQSSLSTRVAPTAARETYKLDASSTSVRPSQTIFRALQSPRAPISSRQPETNLRRMSSTMEIQPVFVQTNPLPTWGRQLPRHLPAPSLAETIRNDRLRNLLRKRVERLPTHWTAIDELNAMESDSVRMKYVITAQDDINKSLLTCKQKDQLILSIAIQAFDRKMSVQPSNAESMLNAALIQHALIIEEGSRRNLYDLKLVLSLIIKHNVAALQRNMTHLRAYLNTPRPVEDMSITEAAMWKKWCA